MRGLLMREYLTSRPSPRSTAVNLHVDLSQLRHIQTAYTLVYPTLKYETGNCKEVPGTLNQ